MDIESLADACGGLAWISERLFEIEGRLATEADSLDPHTRALLARSSRRHGQHAQWWRGLLPDSPALAGAGRICPPTATWQRTVDHIQHALPTAAVAAIYEVALPQLIAVIEHLGGDLSPISDGAVVRAARIVAADLAEEQCASRDVWNPTDIASDEELGKLAIGFVDDYREKRWPPLVTHPR